VQLLRKDQKRPDRSVRDVEGRMSGLVQDSTEHMQERAGGEIALLVRPDKAAC
jgi:hypothetical protein